MCAGPYVQSLLGLTEEEVSRVEAEMLIDDREHLRPGLTRLSLAYFDSDDHVDFCLQAVADVARFGWRLLPFYRYSAVTGEWGHIRQFAKFPERKWLHNANLLGKPFSLVERTTSNSPPPSSADTLNMALKLMQATLDESPAVIEPDGNPLRWFVAPSEALAELRGSVVLEPLVQTLIKPPVFAASSSSTVKTDPSATRSLIVQQRSTAQPLRCKAKPSQDVSGETERPSSRAIKHPRRTEESAEDANSASTFDVGFFFWFSYLYFLRTRKKMQFLTRKPHALGVFVQVAEKLTSDMAQASIFPKPPRDLIGAVINASKVCVFFSVLFGPCDLRLLTTFAFWSAFQKTMCVTGLENAQPGR